MNKIYGFGNAMIDIEIQIEEKDLLEINIEKGNMKHIDDNELKSLLNKYSNNIKSDYLEDLLQIPCMQLIKMVLLFTFLVRWVRMIMEIIL